GTGWTCSIATLTCSRSDSLAALASYPVITLTVNVTLTVPASVTNQVSISGDGAVPGNSADPTVIAAGATDFNANGKPDLLWQSDSTGDVVMWYMGGAQGSTYTGSSWMGAAPGWSVVATADLN